MYFFKFLIQFCFFAHVRTVCTGSYAPVVIKLSGNIMNKKAPVASWHTLLWAKYGLISCAKISIIFNLKRAHVEKKILLSVSFQNQSLGLF